LPFYVGTAQMTENDIVNDIPKKTFRVGVITSGNPDEVKIENYRQGLVKEFGELKFILLAR